MLKLLSKLKDDCHEYGLDLIQSGIYGDDLKLTCEVNNLVTTQLIATIIKLGDDTYKVDVVTPDGTDFGHYELTEDKIIPTLVGLVTPKDGEEVKVSEEVIPNSDELDEVTIEVMDGVFDSKVVPSGTYKNSRYAYSDKYHKMGTIVGINKINKSNNINRSTK